MKNLLELLMLACVVTNMVRIILNEDASDWWTGIVLLLTKSKLIEFKKHTLYIVWCVQCYSKSSVGGIKELKETGYNCWMSKKWTKILSPYL